MTTRTGLAAHEVEIAREAAEYGRRAAAHRAAIGQAPPDWFLPAAAPDDRQAAWDDMARGTADCAQYLADSLGRAAGLTAERGGCT